MINDNVRANTILSLTAAIFMAIIYLLGAVDWSERRIKFNGSFVLVDQGKISGQINGLSEKHPDKYKFQSAVELLLKSEELIKSVSIRYVWPNDVIINVDEVVPVAIVGEKRLLTDDCQIIGYPVSNEDGGFIHFDIGLVQETDFTCRQIMKIIPHVDFNGIKNITIFDNGNFRIGFDGIDYLITGKHISLEIERMKRISSALRDKGMSVSNVDLRYSSGGAILPL